MAPRANDKFELNESPSDRQEIFYDGYLYDVTEWIPRHPGGTIIDYYTDAKEDATIPIQQFHQRSFKQVLAKMKGLPKRPAGDSHQLSQTERHRKLTKDYQELYHDLLDKGFFEPSLFHVFCRYLEIAVYMAVGFYFACIPNSILAKSLSVLFATLGSTRCAWTMHEAGHCSLTGYPRFDRLLEILALNCGIGLSSTCWSSQHNRHHAMPQRIQRDIDLDTLPLLAFNSKVAIGKKYGNTFFTRHQAKLFFTIDTFLVAIFWKCFVHPKYALHKRQYGQLLALAVHYAVSFYFLDWTSYLMVSWLTSIVMFGTFTLSHSHMPVTTENLHWVEYSLLHTTDIEPSWWCDWVMGYLNYQIEHHLFPAMPQFRQRRIIGQVKALAEKHGIEYQCMSYTAAIKRANENLANVSHEIVKQKDI